ncbi:MAG: hypothetical protein M3352_10560 [Bacteroidota bacterium]|nr:hypothetical protein [Bacteroidota bacterium]
MKEKEFRKLEIDLPTQPVRNQRPWLVAGWLFVITILLIAAAAYFMM